MDCGPACLRMIAKYYGRNFSPQKLRQLCGVNREGVSLGNISTAAEKIGLRATGARVSLDELKRIDLPCILHWKSNHFVVLYKISKNFFYIADPSVGLLKLPLYEFEQNWKGKEQSQGVILLLAVSPTFYEQEEEQNQEIGYKFLFRYLITYRRLIIQLLFGLCIGTILQLIAPFLTQSVVDIGINTRNLNFLYLMLIAQGVLIISRVSIDFIRSWILLHISTRINISILTDFLIKLMKLPISYFDTKMTGDIMQRIYDQRKIEAFLTGPILNTIFSAFSLIAFSIVLILYNLKIALIFFTGSALYTCWVLLFMKPRRRLNFKNFESSAKNQSSLIQMVYGMQEIKLNNSEQQKRWEWEHIQARLFKYNVKSLALNQYQTGGATFINEGANLIISFLSAKSVIEGGLTLGGLIAVQYIIGQLNGPIAQFLTFSQGFQDAKISLERLNEVHKMEDEESFHKSYSTSLTKYKTITLQNISFNYPGADGSIVLKNISLQIPQGKTTAIVGMSGSGKTTILKLLLRFYQPTAGEIKVGEQQLNNISFKFWRENCGVVMQDGFIFSDTIERNIAVGDDNPDAERIDNAVKVANIQDFIDSLPLGLNTKIGSEGNGISQGQKQRLLIARAVYKNPEFVFFDEATNALDTNNERIIMGNMSQFFKGKTVIVVAHRLSTVTNADNIVVLDKGEIIEQGLHDQLISLKGVYYNLVKNQLEIG